jgi:ABC-type amino acid transport substrate-binding protein
MTIPTINKFSQGRKRLVTGCVAGFLLSMSVHCFAQNVSAGELFPKPNANGSSSANAAAPKIAVPSIITPDFARVHACGELVVAMLGVNNPPFFYLRGEELVGLEVNMAKEIPKELNVGIRFGRPAKTSNKVADLVGRGEEDLGISKLPRILARAEKTHFITPYLTLNHALILSRLESARISGNIAASKIIKNLRGSLAIINKSSLADFAGRNFPKAKIKAYANWK